MMELGAFSVSLAVKDIEASTLFYKELGLTVFAGDQSRKWPAQRRSVLARGSGWPGAPHGTSIQNCTWYSQTVSARRRPSGA
jgi:catechol 2,3-dioxygenase-like lactoylglutathione lyase family enzyme